MRALLASCWSGSTMVASSARQSWASVKLSQAGGKAGSFNGLTGTTDRTADTYLDLSWEVVVTQMGLATQIKKDLIGSISANLSHDG